MIMTGLLPKNRGNKLALVSPEPQDSNVPKDKKRRYYVSPEVMQNTQPELEGFDLFSTSMDASNAERQRPDHVIDRWRDYRDSRFPRWAKFREKHYYKMAWAVTAGLYAMVFHQPVIQHFQKNQNPPPADLVSVSPPVSNIAPAQDQVQAQPQNSTILYYDASLDLVFFQPRENDTASSIASHLRQQAIENPAAFPETYRIASTQELADGIINYTMNNLQSANQPVDTSRLILIPNPAQSHSAR